MCRHYGNTYKWLFYGDDDTVFFLDAAMEVVKDLDPELPYFLTGRPLYSISQRNARFRHSTRAEP